MSAVQIANYLLGHESQEHARLIRQAGTLAPYTTRLLQLAGIGPGQRVLDLGSGVGDVSLLVAELVGVTGHVTGLERDSSALSFARRRCEGVAPQVTFMECDLTAAQVDGHFDAIIGRFVAMFLPDPHEMIRRLSKKLRPGGVFVLQEPAWSLFFPASAALPLRVACGQYLCKALAQSGARADMGLELHAAMLDAGLTAPKTVIDIPIATDHDGQRWLADLVETVTQRAETANIRGNVEGIVELASRLTNEAEAAKAFAPLVPLVGVIAQSPAA
jgi:SAM-dependent methyltransferase